MLLDGVASELAIVLIFIIVVRMTSNGSGVFIAIFK